MGANTYPIEEWVITEEKFLKEWNYRNETHLLFLMDI